MDSKTGFDYSADGSFCIMMDGQESEWVPRRGVAVLEMNDRLFVGASDGNQLGRPWEVIPPDQVFELVPIG